MIGIPGEFEKFGSLHRQVYKMCRKYFVAQIGAFEQKDSYLYSQEKIAGITNN
jgi:hypothetical protein